MASTAGLRIVGRPFHETFMSFLLRSRVRMPLMTIGAVLLEVYFTGKEGLVYDESLVKFIRPNRGRGTRSAFALGFHDHGGDEKRFHRLGVRVARYAGGFGGVGEA
jgi:hypothetical protein